MPPFGSTWPIVLWRTSTCCTDLVGLSTAWTSTTSAPGPSGVWSRHPARRESASSAHVDLEDIANPERGQETEVRDANTLAWRAHIVEVVDRRIQRAIHVGDAEVRRQARRSVAADARQTQIEPVRERIALSAPRSQQILPWPAVGVVLPFVEQRVVPLSLIYALDPGVRRAGGKAEPRTEEISARAPASDEIQLVSPILCGRVRESSRVRATRQGERVGKPAGEAVVLRLPQEDLGSARSSTLDPDRIAAAERIPQRIGFDETRELFVEQLDVQIAQCVDMALEAERVHPRPRGRKRAVARDPEVDQTNRDVLAQHRVHPLRVTSHRRGHRGVRVERQLRRYAR